MSEKPQTIIIQPKLTGFLLSYIFFSIPGFLISVLVVVLMSTIVITTLTTIVLPRQTTPENTNSLNLVSTNQSESQEGVLVYDLQGAITSAKYNEFNTKEGIFIDKVKADFDLIKKDTRIKNVVFKLNTPGGEVFASEILADLITELQKSFKSQEAVFYFDQIVASGGLWATYKTPNNYVIGSEYGETGSIGVFVSVPNFQGLAEKVGYKETVFKSSEEKDLGNPFRDLSESEKKFFQDSVNTDYNKFKNIIKKGRNLTDAQVDKVATGFINPNPSLVSLGLINEIGNLKTATDRAGKNVQLNSGYNVWEIKDREFFLGDILNSISSYVPALSISKKVENKLQIRPGINYAMEYNLI
jgi:protease-4